MSTRMSWGWGIVALMVLGSLGCEWKGGPREKTSDGGRAETQPRDEGAWRPVPVSMRVYPSSRFVQEGANTVLEARIELLDEMGDTTKGTGHFHFELVDATSAGEAGASGGRLYAWDVPVTTLEQQRLYWDAITRTYQFRLRMDESGPPTTPTALRARLVAPDSEHISAEAGIRQ